MTRVRLGVAMVSTAARRATMKDTLVRLDDGEWIDRIVDEARGQTPNHLAAWQRLSRQNITHGLLLHDDLDASRGWREAATAIATHLPEQRIVALYTPRPAVVARPVHRHPGHITLPPRQWAHGQAVLMPRPVIERYLAWVRARAYQQWMAPAQFVYHDALLAAFHTATRTRAVALTDPPIFQHLGATSSREWRGHDFAAGTHFRAVLAAP